MMGTDIILILQFCSHACVKVKARIAQDIFCRILIKSNVIQTITAHDNVYDPVEDHED